MLLIYPDSLKIPIRGRANEVPCHFCSKGKADENLSFHIHVMGYDKNAR